MKVTHEGTYRVIEVGKKSIWFSRQGPFPNEVETVEINGDYKGEFRIGDLISYKITVEIERVYGQE